MVAYVIVPGITGSGDEHWQTRWELQWGADATRIAPQSWSEPELDDWVEAVDRAVRASSGPADGVILVAHSLGCWAATAWLRTADARSVRGALLVAPPDPAGDAFPSHEAPTFTEVETGELPCRSLVVASTDDPYCPVEVARQLAAAWGSALEVVGARGHLNTASGLGDWSEGRELLHTLERA